MAKQPHRSIVASATFFATAAITASIFYRDPPIQSSPDWSLGTQGATFVALQAVPLLGSALLYFFVVRMFRSSYGIYSVLKRIY